MWQRLRIVLIFTFVMFMLPISVEASSYFNITDNININLDNGAYITLTAVQNFTNISEPVVRTHNSTVTLKSTLEINFNDTQARWNTTSNTTLSNITYVNDRLNFTGNATSGILNISVKMLNNSMNYYLFIDGVKNTSVTSNSSGWVNFNYSGWSQHDFSIRTDIDAPVLTSDSISPSSAYTGASVTITALFVDDTSVASAIVNIKVPNGTSANWSMTCTSGTSVTCTKVYTSTTDVGTYYVMYYYPQDDSGNIANISSTKTFDISTESVVTVSGGGGGGSSFIPYIPSIYNNPPLVIITNVTINSSKLFIKNEGIAEQEYIIKWYVKNNTSIFDTGSFSKKLNSSESSEFLISYNELKSRGVYIFDVIVEYGIYKSEASATITVYDDTAVSYVTEPTVSYVTALEKKGYTESFKLSILVTVVLLIIGIVIFSNKIFTHKKIYKISKVAQKDRMYRVKTSSDKKYPVKKVTRK